MLRKFHGIWPRWYASTVTTPCAACMFGARCCQQRIQAQVEPPVLYLYRYRQRMPTRTLGTNLYNEHCFFLFSSLSARGGLILAARSNGFQCDTLSILHPRAEGKGSRMAEAPTFTALNSLADATVRGFAGQLTPSSSGVLRFLHVSH